MKWLIVTTNSDLSRQYFTEPDMEVLMYNTDVVISGHYEVVYFRDPFNTVVEDKLVVDEFITSITSKLPNSYYVDGVRSFRDMLIEDKWKQYQQLKDYMPATYLVSDSHGLTKEAAIYKKRISARARGIYFSLNEIEDKPADDYIVQPLLPIQQEYRVYTINREVCLCGSIKSSKSATAKVKVKDTTPLSEDVVKFAESVIASVPQYDFLGLDIARTTDNKLYLIEINRSPQFSRYNEMTGGNIFTKVYQAINHRIIA